MTTFHRRMLSSAGVTVTPYVWEEIWGNKRQRAGDLGETRSGERVATHLDGVLVQIGQFLYA